jgi:RIO-like serine/threonine protein kinase
MPPAAPEPIDRTDRPDRVAYSMRALGRAGLPGSFTLGSTTYHLLRTVKHDFFAATAFYRDDAGRMVVLKISRTTDFAGVPLLWLGRWLCRREMRFYNKLADLPNVPKVLGTVGPTGFVHDFVPGGPLQRDCAVPDGFFDELQRLLAELHRRGLAYVDTNKPQNILLGDDGRPHLIDFQISYDVEELGDWAPNRWWLRRLQHEDLYHVLKHKRRMRPDEMTREEMEQAERRSALIRFHRFVTKPYFLLRRRTFKRLRETGRLLPEGSK